MKRVVFIGGGPAGLYGAILLKKALPDVKVEVYERNRPDDTFGWGVVFSDKTMSGFQAADPESHDAIIQGFHHWDAVDVHFGGETIRSNGHGFCGIGRRRLLNIFQERARSLGVEQRFQAEVDELKPFADADLIVASDGINRRVRTRHAAVFRPDIAVGKCRFIWLGTRQQLAAFTFAFEKTEHGWFQIHAYQFSGDVSTVIVETREETWRAHGLDGCTAEQSIAFCESLFAEYLGGYRLMSNANHLRGSAWLNFNRVLCGQWHHQNIVLIGDAAHTAHFGIGSGTKLAMEDATALARVLSNHEGDISDALQRYQEEREIEALKLQSAARNRMEWFEQVERYVHLDPEQFTYSLLTGSQRIGHENLKLRDAGYVRSVEQWFSARSGVDHPVPPMFTPFKVRELSLKNRVIVSPMAMYMAVDGLPNDFHLVHLASRAMGGAAMIGTEMTCVSPEARITPACTGMWNDAQRDAWKRIVDFVHTHTDTKFALQLGHSGRKGSTRRGWEGIDLPLDSGNWPLLSASAIPYMAGVSQTPREATQEDLDRILADV